MRFAIGPQEEKHDVSMQSYHVVREQKSNSNRIHSGRSNYMGSRRRIFSYAHDMARMLSWHAFSGHGWLMVQSMVGDLSHLRAANVVR